MLRLKIATVLPKPLPTKPAQADKSPITMGGQCGLGAGMECRAFGRPHSKLMAALATRGAGGPSCPDEAGEAQGKANEATLPHVCLEMSKGGKRWWAPPWA